MNDLNPDVRRLVDLARKARTPGAEDELRIAERLAIPLAAGAATVASAGAAKAAAVAPVAGAGAKAAGGALAMKLAAVLAVGAAGAALVVTQLGSPPRAVGPAHSAVQARPVAAPAAPARTPRDAAADLPALEPQAADTSAPQKPGASAASVHGQKPANELEQEAELLHRAQSAWRAGQSAQALQLANQHAQRFPRSQLANERDVLRVLSLCKLGQAHAAKQVGARLLRTAKGSPWYQSVAESCAAD